jgi:hypothetical protein
MEKNQQQTAHERSYQQEQLNKYFSSRLRREDLLFALPRLSLGDSDPRARAKGVYILSSTQVRFN